MQASSQQKTSTSTDVSVSVDTEKMKGQAQSSDKKHKDKKSTKTLTVEDEQARQKKAAALCPKNFLYEVRDSQEEAPFKIDACRMPMSYDLGIGFEHQCHDCHYSYGRWLSACAENFVRNGCCTCTPQCPEGFIMTEWHQDSVEKNNYVCLIPQQQQQLDADEEICYDDDDFDDDE